jgi:amidase
MLYTLSSKHISFSFSKSNKEALIIKSGDDVEIETLDCFSNQICLNNDKLESMDWNKLNPVTGPIFIKEALPGDVLEVTIKKIKVADKGVIATGKNLGVLGDIIEGLHFKVVEIKNNKVFFNDKIELSTRPMIGVIGVAPKDGAINCGTPGSHGGNMDTNLIKEGSKLYLPVFVDGALFALGDLHALMGDGEVGVSGVEVSGKVLVNFKVIKSLTVNNPIIKTKEVIASIASAETLDCASSMAVHDMANFIKNSIAMPLEDIAMLFSISGNVEVSQVVDPLKTVRFTMPINILHNLGVNFNA